MLKKKWILHLLSLILLVLGGLILTSPLSLNALGSQNDKFQKIGQNKYVSMCLENPRAIGTIKLIQSTFDSGTYKNDLYISKNSNDQWNIILDYNIYDDGGGLVQKSYTHDITQIMKTYYNQDNDLYVYKFSNLFITLYADLDYGFTIDFDFVYISIIDNIPTYDNFASISLNSITMNNDFDTSNFYAMYQGTLGAPANIQYLEYNSTMAMYIESDNLCDTIFINGLINDWLDYLAPSYFGNYATAYARGYNEGHVKGFNDAINGENGLGQFWGVVGQVFDGVGRVLRVEIVPHINVGLIIFVPLVIGLVGFILWIWRKN